MSWEAWGDDDADRYDHLLEAGWATLEQMDDIRAAVQALRDEPIYEAGRKENGISTRFLMRVTVLSDLVGIGVSPELLAEAKRVLDAIRAHRSGTAPSWREYVRDRDELVRERDEARTLLREAQDREHRGRLLLWEAWQAFPAGHLASRIDAHLSGTTPSGWRDMASAPEGWKLVPVEPTEAMAQAAIFVGTWLDTTDEAADVYRAMLSAAPAAPSQEEV